MQVFQKSIKNDKRQICVQRKVNKCKGQRGKDFISLPKTNDGQQLKRLTEHNHKLNPTVQVR